MVYCKDLLPVVYVVADMGSQLDSPLYGMFAASAELVGRSLAGLDHAASTLGEFFIRQPTAPDAAYSIKRDGEWPAFEEKPRA